MHNGGKRTVTDLPKISVVLPTFNGAAYLGESLNSIVDQSFSSWELIVVDDGSTDTTPEIIQEFVDRDSRIRQVRHTENRNLPIALNTGFSEAKGQYFTWNSDDNVYDQNAFQRLNDVLKRSDEIDIVYADFDMIDAVGRRMRAVHCLPPQELPIRNGIGPCFLYRRSVQDKLSGYEENLHCAEDWDFWLRAFIAGFRFYHIGDNLYRYRDHDRSLTRSHRRMVQAASRKVLEKNLPSMQHLTSATRARCEYALSRRSCALGEFRVGILQFARACRTSPAAIFRDTFLIIFHRVLESAKKILLMR